jgi:putative Holliday junction resolvase
VRILGLDVGEKTIGVAVSDELGLTAQGLTVIRRTSKVADRQALQGIVGTCGADGLVVGLPRNMDGSLGPKARQVQRFAGEVLKPLGLPIEYYDERLTTVSAQRTLLEGDVSRAKRRLVVDQLAAALILQGYLDRRRAQG